MNENTPSLKRRLHHLAVLLLAAFFFCETIGVPYLRLAVTYHKPGSVRIFTHSRCLGPFGIRNIDPSPWDGSLPLILFVKPERPLTERLKAAGAWTLNNLRKPSTNDTE